MRTRVNLICRIVLIGILGVYAALGVGARAGDLTIIELHNRTADEILPVLRPLVGADTALSGVDYKLIVRGNAADVARIRQALQVLDRAPRQMLVSVRFTGVPQHDRTDRGSVIVQTGPQVAVRGRVTTSTQSDAAISSVRVLEGNAAHIAAGESVPVVTAIATRSSTHGNAAGLSMDYRDLTSGFDVLPRVNGDVVVLDITARQQRALDQGNGSAALQTVSTTLSGRLGEWIDLGDVAQSSEQRTSTVGVGGVSHRLSTQSDDRQIAVKVELAQ